MSDFVKVAKASDVSEGRMIKISVQGEDVLLTRVGGQVYAINNTCTHAGGWLHLGTLHPETLEVECPLHEGRFDLKTGAATHEPCEAPAEAYEVRVQGDDIFVGPPIE